MMDCRATFSRESMQTIISSRSLNVEYCYQSINPMYAFHHVGYKNAFFPGDLIFDKIAIAISVIGLLVC